MPPIVAQIIGLLAVVLFFSSYQLKTRVGIIAMNFTARILYTVQYLLLGAISGAVLDIIGSLSCIIADRRESPFVKRHMRLLFLLVNGAMIFAGVFIAVQNRSLADLLPLVGVLLQTGALWLKNERAIRIVSLVGAPFWLSYNLISRAYGSAVGDALTISSILVALFKYRKRQGEKENNNDPRV